MDPLKRGPQLYDMFDIWDDVNIMQQSPQVSNIKDAKYVLFAEDHARGTARGHHSELIDQNVTPGSILLVEGVSSLTELKGENRKVYLSTLYISEYAQKMLTVIGWDRYNYVEQQSPETVFVGDYNQETGRSTIFLESVSPPGLHLSESLALLGEAEDGLYEAEHRQLEELQGSSEEVHQLKDEYLKLMKDVLPKAREALSERIANDFPMRTAAMVETLQGIEKQRLAGKIKGKIFLIGGYCHIIQANTNDERYSLQPLQKTLKQLPFMTVMSKSIFQARSNLEEVFDSGAGYGPKYSQ